jgi:hypothetical protein
MALFLCWRIMAGPLYGKNVEVTLLGDEVIRHTLYKNDIYSFW